MLKEKFEAKEQKDLTPGQLSTLKRLAEVGAVAAAANYKPSEIDSTTMSMLDSTFRKTGYYEFAKKGFK